MNTVVSEPAPRHHCGPNASGYWRDHCWDQAGTVRRCEECGQTWVALAPRRDAGEMHNMWRREGRIERWRRERRARHG